MSFRVQVTAQARADLDRLTQEIGRRAPDGVARFLDGFEDAIDRLEAMPFVCGLAYENPAFQEEIRHFLIRVQKRRIYRALFLVRGDEVLVLTVRAPGERPVSPRDLEIPDNGG